MNCVHCFLLSLPFSLCLMLWDSFHSNSTRSVSCCRCGEDKEVDCDHCFSFHSSPFSGLPLLSFLAFLSPRPFPFCPPFCLCSSSFVFIRSCERPRKPIQSFRSSFINLAIPFFTASEPAPCKQQTALLPSFSLLLSVSLSFFLFS